MMFNDMLKANLNEIKQGFTHDEANEKFSCLICGNEYEEGSIFEFDGHLVEAKKAIRLHIKKEHGSVFDSLLSCDKKYTGLTDIQKELARNFYSGFSDKDIAFNNKISASTVRYQRYNLREKAKQAKIFLAISELMEEKIRKNGLGNVNVKQDIQPIHGGAKMVDERYMITGEEAEKVRKACFISREPLKLSHFPPKQKKKLVVLRMIADQFETGQEYTEKQVNEIIKSIYDDYVTIRRYLIEYGFMDRTTNCGRYWLR